MFAVAVVQAFTSVLVVACRGCGGAVGRSISMSRGGKKRRMNAAKQRQRARKAEILMRRRRGRCRRVGGEGGGGASLSRSRCDGFVLWCCCGPNALSDGGEGVPKVVALLPFGENTKLADVARILIAEASTSGTTATAGVRCRVCMVAPTLVSHVALHVDDTRCRLVFHLLWYF